MRQLKKYGYFHILLTYGVYLLTFCNDESCGYRQQDEKKLIYLKQDHNVKKFIMKRKIIMIIFFDKDKSRMD